MRTIEYTPPPVLREFVASRQSGSLFYDFVVGPIGSGKTTALFYKLAYMASLQQPSPDGFRRTRAVIVRNTRQLLRDTTIASFQHFFAEGEAGYWSSRTDLNFMFEFGDVKCEMMFRPLDAPEDMHRVLSLEVTFAIIDEFVYIPRAIVEGLAGRVGRWRPDSHGTPVTNFGIWGASNADTEDNWWFDYLHDDTVVQQIGVADVARDAATPEQKRIARAALDAARGDRIVRYFRQPGARSPDAENVSHLPLNYYANNMTGKSAAWVRQFIDAEWGFSQSAAPVVPAFNADMHASRTPQTRIAFDPSRPLIVGLDPGLGGSAAVFGQMDMDGRLCVLGEIVAQGLPVTRLIETKIKPYINARFPGARVIVAPDPASRNRAQGDGRTAVQVIAEHFDLAVETNNRLALRLEAIEWFATRVTPAGPAMAIDPDRCPALVRALRGGWRYEIKIKSGAIEKPQPENTPSTHVGDAFGYLARYFHRGGRREERVAAARARTSAPRPQGTYALR